MNRKLEFIDTLNIPDYSLSALINEDLSGLTEEDQENVNAFIEKYDFDFIEVVDSEKDSFFTWHPEFGLACSCVECNIFKWNTKGD